MPKPPGAPRLVPIDEAAAYSRIGRTTLYDLHLRQKKIRGCKVGGRRFLDLDSIDQYLSSLVQAC